MKLRTALLPVIIGAALGLGAAAAPAMAADNANGSTLYRPSDTCDGAQSSAQVAANAVGFVNFHVAGQQVTLNYHLKGADPNATYYVYGYENFCTFKAFLGTVQTNSNGVGNADFSYTTDPGATTVWTFSFDSPFGLAQTVETAAQPTS